MLATKSTECICTSLPELQKTCFVPVGSEKCVLAFQSCLPTSGSRNGDLGMKRGLDVKPVCQISTEECRSRNIGCFWLEGSLFASFKLAVNGSTCCHQIRVSLEPAN